MVVGEDLMGVVVGQLEEARAHLRRMWASGEQIGSVHTLGALHEGHARVIETAAAENETVVVTIYPNKAQLAPGTVYRYDAERDADFAFGHGATHVFAPDSEQMYPPHYRTFLDQGECYQRLDGTVVPFLFRGMITMSVRWISLVRPTRTYWGLKDIGQTLLVRRAVEDLFIDTTVREVPCVRQPDGVPVSSRLFGKPAEALAEVARVYQALVAGRETLRGGERRAVAVIAAMRAVLHSPPLQIFRECYVKIAEPLDFTEPDEVTLPCILHIVVTDGAINHFDGLLLRCTDDVRTGPPMCWLDVPVTGEHRGGA
jgi:pantoate--beta-alanine ligase